MAKDYLTDFRKRMKETRERKGITLKEIAEQIGTTEATVQRYESGNGIKNVTHDKIVDIANALGVSPGYLMGWEAPEPEEADALMDILGDRKLMRYMSMVNEMNDAQKEQVYSYIEFVSSKK